MQFAVAVGTKGNALLDFFVNLGPAVIGRQPIDRSLCSVPDNVVEVDYGGVALATVVAVLGGFELNPFVPSKPLGLGYPGFDELFVTLVVGAAINGVMGLFDVFILVGHFVSPFGGT